MSFFNQIDYIYLCKCCCCCLNRLKLSPVLPIGLLGGEGALGLWCTDLPLAEVAMILSPDNYQLRFFKSYLEIVNNKIMVLKNEEKI